MNNIALIRLFYLFNFNINEFNTTYFNLYNVLPDVQENDKFVDNLVDHFKNEFNSGKFSDTFLNYIKEYQIDENIFYLFDILIKLTSYNIKSETDLNDLIFSNDIKNFIAINSNKTIKSNFYKRVLKAYKKNEELLEKINCKASKVVGNSFTQYRNEIFNYDILTSEEEQRLLKLYQEENDKDAFDELVLHNQKMVLKIASIIFQKNMYREVDVEIMDLIQEGNEGLFSAIKQYDSSYGSKLSTFAYPKIEAKINRYIQDNGRTVRIPVHKSEEINKTYSLQNKYRLELGRELTNAEKSDLIYSVLNNCRNENLYFKSSLDERIKNNTSKNDSSSSYLIDTIADLSVESPDAETNRKVDRELFDKLFNTYIKTARDNDNAKRNVLIYKLRKGLFDDESMKFIVDNNVELTEYNSGILFVTMEECAKHFKLARSRIDKIEKTLDIRFTKMLIPYEYQLTGVEYIFDENTKRAVRKR